MLQIIIDHWLPILGGTIGAILGFWGIQERIAKVRQDAAANRRERELQAQGIFTEVSKTTPVAPEPKAPTATLKDDPLFGDTAGVWIGFGYGIFQCGFGLVQLMEKPQLDSNDIGYAAGLGAGITVCCAFIALHHQLRRMNAEHDETKRHLDALRQEHSEAWKFYQHVLSLPSYQEYAKRKEAERAAKQGELPF